MHVQGDLIGVAKIVHACLDKVVSSISVLSRAKHLIRLVVVGIDN